MASETGAQSNLPGNDRNRSERQSTIKTVRMTLYNANRRGLIASESSFARLRSWLSREAEGSTTDLRSPFWSKRSGSSRTWISREELVKSFDNLISKVEVGHKGLYTILQEVEMGQRGNISPMSPYYPWAEDGPDKVAEVYRDKPRSGKLNMRALERASDRVVSLIATNSVRMTSIDEVVTKTRVNPHSVDEPGMDTHTNSGPPYFVNPWKPNGNTPKDKLPESQAAFEYIVQRAKAAQQDLISGKPVIWNAIVAKRLAQKAKPEKRKRIVIALEKAEPVIWKTFTPELLIKLREAKMPGGGRPFAALNDLPIIDREMQLMLNVANRGKRTVIGGDYSGYDATLAPWLIQYAGKIIGQWVSKGQKLVEALTYSMANNVTLITPNKIWDPQPSSMKSGSGGTNLVDSVINLLVMFYGEEVGAFKIVNCSVQGDDFVLDAEGANPEAIHTIAEIFGLEAHPDKQMYVEGALSFLQRIHYTGYLGGISSVYRTLGSIMSYERMQYRPEDWNPWVDIVRALSQLENCVFSPYFETLVDFVKSGDKYNLGADLAPVDILRLSGDVGKDWIQRDTGKPNKAGLDGENGFSRMVANGVLRGENLPPIGSEARFSRAYRDRAAG